MKDGLADLEMDVPYKVRWGSTVVLKGLEDATVGAFSMINQDDNWSIKATKGKIRLFWKTLSTMFLDEMCITESRS